VESKEQLERNMVDFLQKTEFLKIELQKFYQHCARVGTGRPRKLRSADYGHPLEKLKRLLKTQAMSGNTSLSPSAGAICSWCSMLSERRTETAEISTLISSLRLDSPGKAKAREEARRKLADLFSLSGWGETRTDCALPSECCRSAKDVPARA
jgi:hypothetical protein